MKLLFAGTPDAAVPSLEALIASSHEIIGVITQPPAPAGRGRQLMPSAIHQVANAHSLDVYTFTDINTVDSREALSVLDFDAVAVVAYGQLLKPETLELAPLGWINLHFSLLPAWRGAAPVQRAIMAGDDVTGATTFLLNAGMDTGAILGQMPVEIGSDETAGDLLQRLSLEGAGLLVATFDAIESGVASPREQSTDGVSMAPKITVAEVNLKWHHPALGISRWVRGATPEPGAWTTFGDQRIGIAPVELVLDVSDLAPGQLRISKSEVLVGTGSHALRLGQVKPAGKGWMAAADWARGIRDSELRFEYV